MLITVIVMIAIITISSFVRGSAGRARAEFARRRRFHISTKIAGTGLASRDDLKERNALEDAITSRGIGAIVDAGSGGGWMDLVVAVVDAENGEAQLLRLLDDAGLANRSEIKPLS